MSAFLSNETIDGLDRQLKLSRSLFSSQIAENRSANRMRKLRDELNTVLSEERAIRRSNFRKRIENVNNTDTNAPYIGTVADLILSRRRARLSMGQISEVSKTFDLKNAPSLGETLRNHKRLRSFLILDSKSSGVRRKETNRMLGYRLGGVSLFRTQASSPSDRLVGIRFDTSYRGQYFERFYAFLGPDSNLEEDEGNAMRLGLVRHTLPHFIPAEHLFEQYDIRRWIRNVREYLQAYTCRRQQFFESVNSVLAPNGDHSIQEQSDAFDIVKFVCGPESSRTTISVSYASLLDPIPIEIQVDTNDGSVKYPLSESQNVSAEFSLADFLRQCLDSIGG